MYHLTHTELAAGKHPHLAAILEREPMGSGLAFVPLALCGLLLAIKYSDFFEVDISGPVMSEVSGRQGLMRKEPNNIRSVVSPV